MPDMSMEIGALTDEQLDALKHHHKILYDCWRYGKPGPTGKEVSDINGIHSGEILDLIATLETRIPSITINNLGRKNVFTCKRCKKKTVTIDNVLGQTPMAIMCRVTVGCRGYAESSDYKVDQSLAPTHEWSLPSPEEARMLEQKEDWATIKYLQMGGLLLRKIP